MALSCGIYYNSATELVVNKPDHNGLNIDKLINIILESQQTVYPIELVEPQQIFEKIIICSPELCWFARIKQVEAENLIRNSSKFVGHLIAHYWVDIQHPPRLNSISDILTLPSTNKDELGYQNIFIHDLTIIPDMVNTGIGRELMTRFLEYLSSLSQPVIISLVSVNCSQKFWAKFGFEPITKPTEQQLDILKTYGDDTAVIMMRSINNYP